MVLCPHPSQVTPELSEEGPLCAVPAKGRLRALAARPSGQGWLLPSSGQPLATAERRRPADFSHAAGDRRGTSPCAKDTPAPLWLSGSFRKAARETCFPLKT